MKVNYKRKIQGLYYVENVFDDDGKTKIGSIMFDNKCQVVQEVFEYVRYLNRYVTSSYNSLNRITRDILYLFDFLIITKSTIYDLDEDALKEFINFLKIVKVKKESEYDEFNRNTYSIERTLSHQIPLVSYYKNSRVKSISNTMTSLEHNSIGRIFRQTIQFLKFLLDEGVVVGSLNKRKLPNAKTIKGMLNAKSIHAKGYEIEPVDEDMIFTDVNLELISYQMSGCKDYIKLLSFMLEKTGMRSGEALGVKLPDWNLDDVKSIKGDIVFKRGKWSIKIIYRKDNPTDSLAKSHSKRIVDLKKEDSYVFEMLLTRYLKWRAQKLGRNKSDWLFISNRGNKLTQNTAYKRFKRILDKIDNNISCKLTLHSYRHTFATNELKNGTPIAFIAKIIGHSSPSITFKTYIHLCGLDEAEIRERFSDYVEKEESKHGYKR